MKRAAIVTAAAATISIGSVYASNDNSDNIEKDVHTVYHIYLKNEFLGTVDQKDVIEKILTEKIEKEKGVSKEYHFSLNNQLAYIPEKVFTPIFNNQEAIENVNQAFKEMADAEAIVVDGKPIAFVANKKEAEQVLKQLKMKYVPEEILNALANGSKEVKHDDFIYLDVRFKEKVTTSKGKVFPEDILSVKQAVELLQKGTLETKKHVVKEGEVLGQIAIDYGLTLKQLLQLNPGLKEEELIHIGDELNVTQYQPFVTVVVEMKAVREEVIPFEIEVVKDDSIFKGTTKVKQEGSNGQRIVTYAIERENGVVTKKVVTNETIVKNPTKKIVVKGTKVIPSRGTGDLAWPTVGGYISSPMGYRWGRQHKGIDIARPSNRSILAADNGKVEFAGWDGGYGNKIVINHRNGMKTVYAHLSKIEVKVGQTVSKGQKIGVMGSTGNSTGVHLHFEVYKNGKLVNPRSEL